MKRQKHKYVLLVLDWIILVVAYVIALKLHTSRIPNLLTSDFPYLHPEILFFGGYGFIVILIFQMNQLYRINVCMSITRQLQYLSKSLFYSAVGIALLSFFSKSQIIVDSRLVLFLFLTISFASLIFSRVVIFRSVFKYLGIHNIFPRIVLILGAGEAGLRIGRIIAQPNEYHLHLAGFIDDTKPVGSEAIPDVTVLGRIKDVARVAKRHRINEIVFCLENVSDERFLEVLDSCTKTKALLTIGSDQVGVIPRRLNVENYGEVPVFALMNGVPTRSAPLLKRMFDPALAAIAVVVLLPMFLIVSILIKLDSSGPVLFKQIRVGKNGRLFTFYKFRSMLVGSDGDPERKEKLRQFIGEGKSDKGNSTKIVDDRKVTRVGRFLRKTSIDEVPQLFNVIKGDMSLVGPRPCLPYEWENYAAWHKRRLSITPGCTGVWQVLGRSEVGFRDMVILDLFYTYNISFHLDAWLVLKTIPVMFFGTGGK